MSAARHAAWGARGEWEHFDQAAIEQAGALRGVDRAAGIGGQGFLAGRLAHEHLIAARSGLDHDAFGLHPAGDGGGVSSWPNSGAPSGSLPGCQCWRRRASRAALFGDDQLAANLHLVDLLGAEVGEM